MVAIMIHLFFILKVGRARMSSPAGSPKGGGYVGLAGAALSKLLGLSW